MGASTCTGLGDPYVGEISGFNEKIRSIHDRLTLTVIKIQRTSSKELSTPDNVKSSSSQSSSHGSSKGSKSLSSSPNDSPNGNSPANLWNKRNQWKIGESKSVENIALLSGSKKYN